MGAFVIIYVVGSIIAIPFLAYHLLRTRRDLKGLRAELIARGVITPTSQDTHAALASWHEGVQSLGEGRAMGSGAQGEDAVRAEPPAPGGPRDVRG